MSDPWDEYVVSVQYRGFVEHERVVMDGAGGRLGGDWDDMLRLSVGAAAMRVVALVNRRAGEYAAVRKELDHALHDRERKQRFTGEAGTRKSVEAQEL